VKSQFTASLHLSDFVQTQNEAKILNARAKQLPIMDANWKTLQEKNSQLYKGK
jgi:hypothetical protein